MLHNNEFLVVNQYTIIENNQNKRPDILLFINGIPIVLIELKNAADENATIRKAFDQIQTYKATIPGLFTYKSKKKDPKTGITQVETEKKLAAYHQNSVLKATPSSLTSRILSAPFSSSFKSTEGWSMSPYSVMHSLIPGRLRNAMNSFRFSSLNFPRLL